MPFKFKKKRNYLKQIYKQNPETNAFIIEVSLDNYNEVFNGWDPSPIKRRDLDPEMLEYIYQCSKDIPLKWPVELNFIMPKQQYDETKEELTKTGVINNFNFIIHFTKKAIKNDQRKIFIYAMLSFIFLTLATILPYYVKAQVLTKILLEGMFIGGWVFMWEVFSLIFFTDQDMFHKVRLVRRLLDASINFYYL